jgi:ABC-type polysaccharide/polyol phosphate transport system ATPase subunit
VTARHPLVEAHDLGLFYRLHQRNRVSLKHMLLHRSLGGRSRLHWALRHVDLHCHAGETWGIVGPNGAGKSTLCLLLSNILTPDEGRLEVRGEVSALVSIGAGLNRDLSGRANIHLMAAFLGIPRKEIEKRSRPIIEWTELGDFIDEPVRHYSSGMKSRLTFAVATELRPEILILDESLSVGDRKFRAKSEKRMAEMMEQSKLIVIVSHDTSFLRGICSHALWLESGEVRLAGAAKTVLDAYEGATDETG